MNSHKITVLFEAKNEKTAIELQDAITDLINKLEGAGAIFGCVEVLEPVELDKKEPKWTTYYFGLEMEV